MEKEETLRCTPRGQVAALKSKPVQIHSRQDDVLFVEERHRRRRGTRVKAVQSTVRTSHVVTSASSTIASYRSRSDKTLPLPNVTTYLLDHERNMTLPIYRLYTLEPHYLAAAEVETPQGNSVRRPRYRARSNCGLSRWYAKSLQPSRLRRFMPATSAVSARAEAEHLRREVVLHGLRLRLFLTAAHAIMLGKSYVSDRTYDVFGAKNFVRYHGFGHRTIHIVAKGYGSIPAALATLLHPGG